MSATNTFLAALRTTLGSEQVLTNPSECAAYSHDDGRIKGQADVVVFANTTEQVQSVVRLCNQYQVPLTVRGGGTGTPGGAVPITGGLVLSIERLNKIIKLDSENRAMVVEPGVTNQQVQTAAAQIGMFWAPDPGSANNCMIGGNLGYNAAGPRALKYGSTRENTLALQAVTGTGEIINTGSYTTKSAIGYDLTRLLIGSEGTLAIITAATLKLLPLPETKQTIRAIYKDIQSAAQAILTLMSHPIQLCALEFVDDHATQLLCQHGVDLPEAAGALLMIELDGFAIAVQSEVQKVIQLASNPGLVEIKVASDAQESQQLWAARKALSPALRTLGLQKINEDIVIPVSQIANLLARLTTLAQQSDLKIVNFGHAGNGNIHVNILFDPQDPKASQRAIQCLSAMFDCVIELGGTLSGEHGIGAEKRDFMPRAIDTVSLGLMRQIKKIFDPNGILNPGKILP